METFRYNSLDLEGRSFRLLRLSRGDGPQIDCEIFEAWLEGNDTIPYEALSYAWGDLATPHDIVLNGTKLAITANLHSALRHLRVEDEDRVLWVDAICIDQSNAKERGHQVTQMGDIYAHAEQVVFWLGETTPDMDFAMNFLKQLERRSLKESTSGWSLQDRRWQTLWCETRPHWTRDSRFHLEQGLRELLDRPWFYRVWIVQEVARAKRAVICAGGRKISSRILAIAPALMNVTPNPQCQAVLDVMPGTSRNTSWWSEQRDLYTLLHKFRHSEASDPRDKIYALLGISADASVTYNLQPDYTMTAEKVIDDVIFSLFGLPPHKFRTMDEFLDELPHLTGRALIALAGSGSASDVVKLLQERRHVRYNSAHALIAAAGNEKFGAEVMETLLMQPEVSFSWPIVGAAIKNTSCGEAILHQLLRQDLDWLVRATVFEVVYASAHRIGCAPAFDKWLREQRDPILTEITNKAIESLHTKRMSGVAKKFSEDGGELQAGAVQEVTTIASGSFS